MAAHPAKAALSPRLFSLPQASLLKKKILWFTPRAQAHKCTSNLTGAVGLAWCGTIHRRGVALPGARTSSSAVALLKKKLYSLPPAHKCTSNQTGVVALARGGTVHCGGVHSLGRARPRLPWRVVQRSSPSPSSPPLPRRRARGSSLPPRGRGGLGWGVLPPWATRQVAPTRNRRDAHDPGISRRAPSLRCKRPLCSALQRARQDFGHLLRGEWDGVALHAARRGASFHHTRDVISGQAIG